jgi:WD40-like Beta Propeller Repeat
LRYSLLFALPLLQCAPQVAPPADVIGLDGSDRVDVRGYTGDIMEPFLSRDGQVLFFNNRNSPPEKTDLHWARRIDDLHFTYGGLISGANSAALDGVPSMSADRNFCFVSTRSYERTLATIYCGQWTGADVSDVTLQSSAAALIPGRVTFDFEVSPAGDYAILADGLFNGGSIPVSADLRLARRDGGFRIDPKSDGLFARINTSALEYAAGLSADGLTLCFTRLASGLPSIWIATRATEGTAFSAPRQASSIRGFVEACTFALDGAIYFHRLDGDRYTLRRATAY